MYIVCERSGMEWLHQIAATVGSVCVRVFRVDNHIMLIQTLHKNVIYSLLQTLLPEDSSLVRKWSLSLMAHYQTTPC